MTVSNDDILALSIINQSRASGIFCCIDLSSDYDFCWEVKWVKAKSRSHKEHRTLANDTLLEAVNEFIRKTGFSPA